MPDTWLTIAVGLVGSAFGAFVGVKVAIASLKERVSVVEKEIEKLREAKHEHAQFLTRHELDIETLKRKVDER